MHQDALQDLSATSHVALGSRDEEEPDSFSDSDIAELQPLWAAGSSSSSSSSSVTHHGNVAPPLQHTDHMSDSTITAPPGGSSVGRSWTLQHAYRGRSSSAGARAGGTASTRTPSVVSPGCYRLAHESGLLLICLRFLWCACWGFAFLFAANISVTDRLTPAQQAAARAITSTAQGSLSYDLLPFEQLALVVGTLFLAAPCMLFPRLYVARVPDVSAVGTFFCGTLPRLCAFVIGVMQPVAVTLLILAYATSSSITSAASSSSSAAAAAARSAAALHPMLLGVTAAYITSVLVVLAAIYVIGYVRTCTHDGEWQVNVTVTGKSREVYSFLVNVVPSQQPVMRSWCVRGGRQMRLTAQDTVQLTLCNFLTRNQYSYPLMHAYRFLSRYTTAARGPLTHSSHAIRASSSSGAVHAALSSSSSAAAAAAAAPLVTPAVRITVNPPASALHASNMVIANPPAPADITFDIRGWDGQHVRLDGFYHEAKLVHRLSRDVRSRSPTVAAEEVSSRPDHSHAHAPSRGRSRAVFWHSLFAGAAELAQSDSTLWLVRRVLKAAYRMLGLWIT